MRIFENGGVWTLPTECRPTESFEFELLLIEKASQIYVFVIFISLSLNVNAVQLAQSQRCCANSDIKRQAWWGA